jgi:hypothetical protein
MSRLSAEKGPSLRDRIFQTSRRSSPWSAFGAWECHRKQRWRRPLSDVPTPHSAVLGSFAVGTFVMVFRGRPVSALVGVAPA